MATIKLKSSVVAAKVPTTSDIAAGETAVNHADKRLYFRNPSTDEIWHLANSAGGGGSTSYLVQSAFSSPYHYIGRAPLGTLTTDATWDIARIEIASDGSTTTLNATGAWTNRASLSYT
jgi:hypothetical protein